jgi:hypothetical protein
MEKSPGEIVVEIPDFFDSSDRNLRCEFGAGRSMSCRPNLAL